MEYRDIFLLQNQYPSIANYDTMPNSDIILNGVYPQNFLEFTIPSFQDIEVVENTNFKFILAIKETAISDETKYFTSPNFYSDLETSKVENNPYHLQTALDAGLFVNINLDKQIELFNQLKLIDYGVGVKMNQNIHLLNDNTIDYVTLVQYIDWVVSKSDPLDNDTNGVIPGEKISDFEIGKFDPVTGEFISLQEQAVALQVRVDSLNEELVEIEAAIEAMGADLPEEPSKRKTGVLEIISLGLGAVSVVQGVSSAVKVFGKAAGGLQSLSQAGTGIAQQGGSGLLKGSQAISQQVQGAASVGTDLIKGPATTLVQSTTNTAVQAGTSAAKTLGNTAKEALKNGNKIFNTIKNTGSKIGSAVGKTISSTAKIAKQAVGSKIGQAAVGIVTTASAVSALDPAAARKKQTDIVLKSVAKSAAVEVGKVVVKQAIKKAVIKGVTAKVLGAAAGPIGAGVMAAIGIVKFFINKSKEKKEYEKQKKEYDKIMGEFDRLVKRRDDILAEIDGIIRSGKLKLAREFDERFSSTQKYFANIGAGIAQAQQATQGPVPTITTSTAVYSNRTEFGG